MYTARRIVRNGMTAHTARNVASILQSYLSAVQLAYDEIVTWEGGRGATASPQADFYRGRRPIPLAAVGEIEGPDIAEDEDESEVEGEEDDSS